MRRIGLAVILAVGLFAAVILAVGLYAAGRHSPFKGNAIKSDAPLAIQAQPERSKPRIAVIFNAVPIAEISGPNPKQSSMRAFLEGMRAHGWIDGQNITIERRSAEGHDDRFLPLAQEMVNLKVEVLVISGNAFVLAVTASDSYDPDCDGGLRRQLREAGTRQELCLARRQCDRVDVLGRARNDAQ